MLFLFKYTQNSLSIFTKSLYKIVNAADVHSSTFRGRKVKRCHKRPTTEQFSVIHDDSQLVRVLTIHIRPYESTYMKSGTRMKLPIFMLRQFNNFKYYDFVIRKCVGCTKLYDTSCIFQYRLSCWCHFSVNLCKVRELSDSNV